MNQKKVGSLLLNSRLIWLQISFFFLSVQFGSFTLFHDVAAFEPINFISVLFVCTDSLIHNQHYSLYPCVALIEEKTSWWRLFFHWLFCMHTHTTFFSPTILNPQSHWASEPFSHTHYHFVCFIVSQTEKSYVLPSRWAIYVCLFTSFSFLYFLSSAFFVCIIILWFSLEFTIQPRINR